MTNKEKFEKEALAEFLNQTGIPKAKIDQYCMASRIEFRNWGETYELKNPGLAVMFRSISPDGFLPVLYFPKNRQDISEHGGDAISREEAIDTIRKLYIDLATQKYVIDLLKVLPSVTPRRDYQSGSEETDI